MKITENLIRENFEYLFEEAVLKEIAEKGIYKQVQAGGLLIDFSDTIKHIPLLLSGALKIARIDEEGDELLLYFIEKGDTCAMTLTCCVGQAKSEIRATAETDSELVLVPVELMDVWIQKYSSWRNFIFESYHNRFSEMLESIDSLAFMNQHDRVFKYLREKVIVSKDHNLTTTHQEIAIDLNTSRVVISRILKSLEKENKIKIHRNKIEVLEF